MGISEEESASVFNWMLFMYGAGILSGISLVFGFEEPIAFLVSAYMLLTLKFFPMKKNIMFKIDVTAVALGLLSGILVGSVQYDRVSKSLQHIQGVDESTKYVLWGPLGIIRYGLVDHFGG